MKDNLNTEFPNTHGNIFYNLTPNQTIKFKNMNKKHIQHRLAVLIYANMSNTEIYLIIKHKW